MKALCGDYAKDRPRLRWWKSVGLRVAVVFIGLVFVAAATPAMHAYYKYIWSGQNSVTELDLSEAIVLAQDEKMPLAHRRSATLKVFVEAKKLIEILQLLRMMKGKVGDDAEIYLDKLKNLTRD